MYRSKYTLKELKYFAKKIKMWSDNGLDIFAYFNNDAFYYAADNASTLKMLTH